VNWYLAVLKNYAGFSGRARRQEYWMYALFNFIVTVVLEIFFASTNSIAFPVILGIYGLATIIPSLAVLVRRLHDTNRSGGWFFIAFVPLVGAIILLVFTCTEGDRNINRFGPDPKQATPVGDPGYSPQNYSA
jgi:uncharacterized membrane protein YhaH (DUF805 family)